MFKPLHSKKLPRTRSPQPKTIFIISAHDIARLFVVEQYDLHELSPLHTEATDYNYSDKEGFSYVSSTSRTGASTIQGFREKTRMHNDHVFAKYLAEEIKKFDRQYQAYHIIIYAPKDLTKLLVEAFPKSYVDKLAIYVGDYIKISTPKLLTLIHEAGQNYIV